MDYSTKPVLLYIITKSELGGAQTHTYELIKNFCADYQVHLATGSTGMLTENISTLGVPVYLISNLRREISLLKDLLAVKECISLINYIKPDIIHTHSSKAGIVGRIAGWLCRISTVFTAHGWSFTSGTPKFRSTIALIAEKLFALFTAKLICVCECDRLLAIKLGVGTQNSLVTIYNGISNIPVPIANPSIQPPRLMMVARFNEQKDYKTLLKAISQVSSNYVHLELVGSGSLLTESKALALSLGIADRVSFLGDRTDVPDLLAQSQIFILSTHYEGLPISVLEAMRAGLPIVATSVNGIPEAVIHGKTGLLVPYEDVQALTKALQTLIQSPNLRQQMGEAGRKRFEQEFTVERMTTQTRIIYDQILKNNRALR